MKKILFGLAAMSTLAFSAINLKSPTNETNTWMTGEIGAITVNGTITSAVPQVQYVVYASTTGDYDANGEALQLADFVISQKEVENVFSAENPKVYVKKVNGTQDGVENLLDTDVVKFKIEVEANRATRYSTDYFGKGGSLSFEATALLSDATLDEVATSVSSSLGNTTIIVEKTYGMFYYRSGSTNYYYYVTNGIKFESTENGVLQVVSAKAPYATGSKMGASQISAMENAFSSGKQLSNVRILVTVNA